LGSEDITTTGDPLPVLVATEFISPRRERSGGAIGGVRKARSTLQETHERNHARLSAAGNLNDARFPFYKRLSAILSHSKRCPGNTNEFTIHVFVHARPPDSGPVGGDLEP
jgi:hypothetical protein